MAGMTPWENEQHKRFINTCVHSNQIYLRYLRHEILKPAQNDSMIMAKMVWQCCKLAWCKLLNWPQVATRMIRCALVGNGAAQDWTALVGSPMSVGLSGIPLDIRNVCFMLRLWNASRGRMRQECADFASNKLSAVTRHDNTVTSLLCNFQPVSHQRC